ncbi:unnamed protein product [Brugia pahangi]|uniref:Uncharacterized protein n=1 Tax=Brugia pahangi TaxID=6280 RepID=A0A0N4TXB0_BRUPA|nr:unnamed protein product [Brugia pahangi]
MMMKNAYFDLLKKKKLIICYLNFTANYNDRLARDFMHFGKRSPNIIIPQFDRNIASLKRGEFSRDFMNFGKRSIGDDWSDITLKVGDSPELLHKKSSTFDRDFMNFGKRAVPFERNLINSNKKSGIDSGAFDREFLSFGKRSTNIHLYEIFR